MDHFGIGAAIQAMVLTYQTAARRTGRTTSLVESVKDGDRIVCATAQDADALRRLLRERGVDVECVVIPPDQGHRLFERGTSRGRTICDHTWIEQRYAIEIRQIAESIDRFEREASGYGAAHRETALQARELSKWRR